MFKLKVCTWCLNGPNTIHRGVNTHRFYRNSRVQPLIAAAFTTNDGGSGGDSNTNSFLRHPPIAQREALRQFYLSTCPEEQLKVIETSIDYLDAPTSLHMCCHLADLSLKGQLEGDATSQDALMHALFNILADNLPSLPSQSIGAVLWSMATVSQNQDAAGVPLSQPTATSITTNWKAEAIEQVALLEGGCGKVAKYNTKELVNILFSVGALQGQPTPSKAVVTYSTELMEHLAARMDSTPYVKGSLSPSDFADLVSVCAKMFVTASSTTSAAAAAPTTLPQTDDSPWRESDQDEERLPQAALQLMDLVAGEVRRQLANRSSSRAAFLPRELTRFLTNFASLEIRNNSNVEGMFDVISGFAVNRIRAKHLNAVTKPDDLAAVLAAYAKQQHRSVSVPELLTAVGEQLRINAAQMQLYIAHETKKTLESTNGSSSSSLAALAPPVEGGPPDVGCSFPTLISILESHKELGFAPDPLTLTALLPGIKRTLVSASHAPTAASEKINIVQLLKLFLVFQFNPGPGMLELLVAKIEEEESSESSSQGDAFLETARGLVVALTTKT